MTKLESERREIITGISTINSWFSESLKDSNNFEEMPIPSERPMRHIKISFLWSMYYLKNNYSCKNAIKDVISKGGDLRTNAAVVGGLIGAASILPKLTDNRYKKSIPKIKSIIKNAPSHSTFRVIWSKGSRMNLEKFKENYQKELNFTFEKNSMDEELWNRYEIDKIEANQNRKIME